MSDNLGITRLPQGASTPEVMLNAAFSEIDALLSEAVEIDLSTGNASPSLAILKGGSFLSLNGAAEARTLTLPQTKRTLFVRNNGTAEVTLSRGTGSVAVPAGQSRTVRLTGTPDGLLNIGGGGGGASLPAGGTDGQYLAKDGTANGDAEWRDLPASGGGGIVEAPSDGKTYGRKDAAWAEIPASAGGSSGVAPKFSIWRLYCGIKAGQNQVGLSTLNINNAVLSTTPIAASSTENATSYSANNARPGVSGSWYSAPNTDLDPWIEYTFPAPIDGDSIYIYHETSNATYAPSTIRLEARNSTSDPWTVVIPTTPHKPTNPGGDASYGIPRIGGSGGSGGSGGVYPVSPPTPAEYPIEVVSTGVTGSMKASAGNCSFLREDLGASNSDKNFMRLKDVSNSAQFTFDALFLQQNQNRYGYQRMGIVLRETSTDKYSAFYHASESNSPVLARLSFTGAEGASASFAQLAPLDGGTFGDIMLRIKITAKQLEYYYSHDYGLNFFPLGSVNKSPFWTVGPDKVGLVIQTYNNVGKKPMMNVPYAKLTIN